MQCPFYFCCVLFCGLILMSNTCAKEKEKKGEKNLRHVNQTRTPEKSSNQEANKNSSVGGLWLRGDLGLSLVDIC